MDPSYYEGEGGLPPPENRQFLPKSTKLHFIAKKYLKTVQITFNKSFCDIFVENMVLANLELIDWSFFQIALIPERNELWGHMRAR